ncbi:MAG TPA: universal stress protein, partial [Marmoricola sp.]|nr:universal stress protein [Marmoricola sp.]
SLMKVTSGGAAAWGVRRRLGGMNTIAPAGGIAPGSIVVGIAEETSEAALEWAVTEATMTGRPIVLVHVISPLDTQQRASLWKMGVSPDEVLHDTQAAAQSRLAELAQQLEARGVVAHVVIEQGDVAEILATRSAQAYRLVVGSRGRGAVGSRLFGSVGSSVVRHADCPAVVVRPTHGAEIKPGIVVSASPSAEGQATLEAAFLEAEGRHCALTVVAHDPRGVPTSGHWGLATDRERREEMRLEVAEAVAGLQLDHPDVAVSTCVADGSLLHALLDIGGARESIVIERPGDDGCRGHFGVASSLATSVVEHASTTVMVVP